MRIGRLCSLVMALAMTLTLVGCGDGEKGGACCPKDGKKKCEACAKGETCDACAKACESKCKGKDCTCPDGKPTCQGKATCGCTKTCEKCEGVCKCPVGTEDKCTADTVCEACKTDPIVRPANAKPKLFVEPLPITYNTPDGMTLAKDGNLYLSVPNFNELRKLDILFKPEIKEYPNTHPAFIAKIDKDNKVEKFSDLPLHPVSKRCGPMGLDQGPDGHLYIADNQYFFDTNHASRLVRVKIAEDGTVAGTDVVAEGFKLSNAVAWKGDYVYVSDTFFDLHEKDETLLDKTNEDGTKSPSKGWSGVYRFHIDEFKDGPVKLKPYGEDTHCIAKFVTYPNHRGDIAGADGMTFDKDGNLYVGNFGDGVISKITFDKDDNVASQTIFVKTPTIPSCDGIIYDETTNQIYVTDSEQNAVHIVKPDGRFCKIWDNEDTDGADGLLDQPCEPCLRGSELILICFDMAFPGLRNKGYDGVNTIHVIDLTPKK